MRNLLVFLILSVAIIGTQAKADGFDPSLDLGVGIERTTPDGGNSYFYGVIKSYMLRTPSEVVGLKFLGIGYGLNTNGDSQLILSPASLTLFSLFAIAPDYGIGLGNGRPNFWGVSVGLSF